MEILKIMNDFLNIYYEIDFANNNQKETLRYKIADTPVSRIWLDRVRWHLALPDCHIFNNQWKTTYPSIEKIQKLWRSMKKLVDDANSGQFIKVDYIDMPPEYDPNADNKSILNYLHFEFHRFEEIPDRPILEYDPLIQLNVQIHELECMLVTPDDNQEMTLSCGFFLHGTKPINGGDFVVPIEDPSLYQYWNYDDDFGDLLLGYHTIGKDLHHCWIDNDKDLIIKGFVRPQTTISNEVNCLFRGNGRNVGACDRTVQEIHDWVRDNNLDQYIDLSKPEHSLVGRPFLGKLEGNYTRDDINSILENNHVESVRLIE